jgi:hypothetical protein
MLCKPSRAAIDDVVVAKAVASLSIQEEHVTRKVLRGYAKGQDGNLIFIGTFSVPHSKDKPSLRERQDKRHLFSWKSFCFGCWQSWSGQFSR